MWNNSLISPKFDSPTIICEHDEIKYRFIGRWIWGFYGFFSAKSNNFMGVDPKIHGDLDGPGKIYMYKKCKSKLENIGIQQAKEQVGISVVKPTGWLVQLQNHFVLVNILNEPCRKNMCVRYLSLEMDMGVYVKWVWLFVSREKFDHAQGVRWIRAWMSSRSRFMEPIWEGAKKLSALWGTNKSTNGNGGAKPMTWIFNIGWFPYSNPTGTHIISYDEGQLVLLRTLQTTSHPYMHNYT